MDLQFRPQTRLPPPAEKGGGHPATANRPWLAGGGIQPGITHGESDEHGYGAAKDQCHVHGFQAAILNQMGLDHTKLTYRHDGRDFGLPGVERHVICEILL